MKSQTDDGIHRAHLSAICTEIGERWYADPALEVAMSPLSPDCAGRLPLVPIATIRRRSTPTGFVNARRTKKLVNIRLYHTKSDVAV